MRALKALVVLMGILIAGGLALLAYAVIGGLSGDLPDDDFGDTTVVVPPGCVIAEATVAEGMLVLRLDGPALWLPCQQVILLDPESGRELGRVKAKEGP